MKKIAFDIDKYLNLQSKNILDRVNTFGEKLYLEFGGKLFDDYHASRILPGFLPDTKLRMLKTIKEKVEIIITICANDIMQNKVRSDVGLTYESDVLRLIDAFTNNELMVGSVVITQYENQKTVNQFITKLNNLNIKTYKHYKIDSYPYNIELILSDKGFGKNDYIETTKPLVVITAPGPGSGKLATCLSQLYHDHVKGIKAGYAKYETFPVWNLALRHPVNIAYEAATLDLNDVNVIDPFHLEKYNVLATNYNRDVDAFPIIKSMLEQIFKESPYHSPTDMGVNMVGYAIIDDNAAIQASKDEIIRRYLNALYDNKNGKLSNESLDKAVKIMTELKISVEDRICVKHALLKEEESNTPSMSLELSDGQIITGKTTDTLSSSATIIINALKYLAKIQDDVMLLSPSVIEPMKKMKIEVLNEADPTLHVEDVLLALAMSATTNPIAELALKQINKLQSAQTHSSTILNSNDIAVFKKLKIDVTFEPKSFDKKFNN